MDWVDRPKNYKGLYGILQSCNFLNKGNKLIALSDICQSWEVLGQLFRNVLRKAFG